MKGLFLVMTTILLINSSFAVEMDSSSIDCDKIVQTTGTNSIQFEGDSGTVVGVGGTAKK